MVQYSLEYAYSREYEAERRGRELTKRLGPLVSSSWLHPVKSLPATDIHTDTDTILPLDTFLGA